MAERKRRRLATSAPLQVVWFVALVTALVLPDYTNVWRGWTSLAGIVLGGWFTVSMFLSMNDARAE